MMEVGCRQIPEVIADVLGGEARPPKRASLERHIEDCGACATTYHDLAAILERTRATATSEPPAPYWRDFLPALRARIAEGETGRPPLSAWLRPIIAGAALAWLALTTVPPGAPQAGANDLWVEELRRFAFAIDPSASDAPPLAWEGALHLTPAATVGAPTGDLFSFYELALDLTDEQAETLLRELGEDSEG